MPGIPDDSREIADIVVECGSVANLWEDVIFSQTSFEVRASAEPGTATVVLRDPLNRYNFEPGVLISLYINGMRMWQGFVFTVEQGYLFPDKTHKRIVLHCVDLNILLDKLVLYNHDHPNWYPSGGGAYSTDKTGVVAVPLHTEDATYIRNMLADFDIPGGPNDPTGKPKMQTLLSPIGQINPDGKFTPPSAGATLRGFMADVSRTILQNKPGSTIWYVDPEAFLIYQGQDTNLSNWSVGDYAAPNQIRARGLSHTMDISRIKNDVLIFANRTNPTPGSTQEYLYYRHNSLSASVFKYGRFQYTETVEGWLQELVNARSTKLLYQEGSPAESATFTLFKRGDLYPGQITTVNLSSHGISTNVPIRGMKMSFPAQDLVQYDVSCSFDTQDPWGLLLALRRPPSRGFKPPTYIALDLTDGSAPPPTDYFTYVKEYPRKLSSTRYETAYGFVRYSLSVYIGGSKKVNAANMTFATAEAGYFETDPDGGIFTLGGTPPAGSLVYVEYYKSVDKVTQ